MLFGKQRATTSPGRMPEERRWPAASSTRACSWEYVSLGSLEMATRSGNLSAALFRMLVSVWPAILANCYSFSIFSLWLPMQILRGNRGEGRGIYRTRRLQFRHPRRGRSVLG